MSCEWDIVCVTCSCKGGLFDRATSVEMYIQDANHADALMEAIIDEQETFEKLTAAYDRQPKGIWDMQLQLNYRFIPWQFFRDHQGHDLHPINEYGDISPCRRTGGKPCDLKSEQTKPEEKGGDSG